MNFDLDLDLSCSESSADLTPEADWTRSLRIESSLMEYRVLSSAEARSELQWLLHSECSHRSLICQADLSKQDLDLRLILVDTIYIAGERMNLSFTTKLLAISYLDRYMATMSCEDQGEVSLIAMGCLSIAAKLDEVCLPTQMLASQLHACWELEGRRYDLKQVEFVVMSALGLHLQDVTAAPVLDTLICLLGYQNSSTCEAGCYEQMHIVRESCRLLLAKAYRDPQFRLFRPSSVATAAVLLLLKTFEEVYADLSTFQLALDQLFWLQHDLEIRQCMQLLRSYGVEHIPSLKECRVEVRQGDGVVQVYQQKVVAEITTTPTSVLQTATAMAMAPSPARGAVEYVEFPTDALQTWEKVI